MKKFGTVEVDTYQVIISVVRDLVASTKGNAGKIFEALKEVPIRMISYGGSNYNVSLVINAEDKKTALNALSQHIF